MERICDLNRVRIGNRLSMPNHTKWRRKSNFSPEVYGANGNSKLCRQVIKYFFLLNFEQSSSIGVLVRMPLLVPVAYSETTTFYHFRKICQSISGVPDAVPSLPRIVAGMHFEVYCIFRAATANAISIRTCIKFVHCHCHLVENAISVSVCETEFSLLRRYGYVCMCRRRRHRRAVSSFAPFCIHIPYALHTYKYCDEHMHLVRAMAYPYSHYLLPSFARQTIDSRTTVQL